jgi:haloacid dehalogenase superfamily, subfamily IA, variant 3 with third motif having DD or ED/haloacid dehalogenase superfamily, subfamily IA, variant 1 with third motif having Dx(3-4)D or Dx(3-4)E
MNVKCLIFDMDGLMFDSEVIAEMAYKKAVQEFGYEISNEIYYQLLGRNKADAHIIIKELMGEEYPAHEIHKLAHEFKYEHIQEHGLPMKKGLMELLEFAKQKGILMAVASSSDKSIIEGYLKLGGIETYFDYIISGEQVVHSKPNPEIFLRVCRELGVTPKEALVLEDSKNGIMAAVNGNIPVICIPDILDHEDEITKLTYKTLPDLTAVMEYL